MFLTDRVGWRVANTHTTNMRVASANRLHCDNVGTLMKPLGSAAPVVGFALCAMAKLSNPPIS